MIGRPAGRRRLDPVEPELGQIERIDERVDHANRIALVDQVIEAFRQQRRLPAIRPRNKALHAIPPQIARRIIQRATFSHSQGHHRQSSGVSRTDGLPSATDAPLQRGELAESATSGHSRRRCSRVIQEVGARINEPGKRAEPVLKILSGFQNLLAQIPDRHLYTHL